MPTPQKVISKAVFVERSGTGQVRRDAEARLAAAPPPPPPPPDDDVAIPSVRGSLLKAVKAGAKRVAEAADGGARAAARREEDRRLDADACLLAARRCLRTLAHALFWTCADDADLGARLAVELRSTANVVVELADARVAEGRTSAAAIAADDVLHALAGVREWRRRSKENDETLRGVSSAACLGLVRDRLDALHGGAGGPAAACARAALEPAADAADADAALTSLGERLDAATAADRDELDDMVPSFLGGADDEGGAHEFSESDSDDDQARPAPWLEPGDATDLNRRAALALARCALGRATARRQRDDAEREDDKASAAHAAAASRREADVEAELEGTAPPSFGQIRWALDEQRGDGLRRCSAVAPRRTAVPAPLTAHDDAEANKEHLAKAQKSHDDVMKKRLADADLAKALKAKERASTSGVGDDSDSDEEAADKPSPSKAPKSPQPAPQEEEEPAHDEDGEVLCRVDDAARVTRLGLVRGSCALTERRLTFAPKDASEKRQSWRIRDVTAVLMRRYRLRDAGLEVYGTAGASLFLDCTPEPVARAARYASRCLQ